MSFDLMYQFLQEAEAAKGTNAKKQLLGNWLSKPDEESAPIRWMLKAALDQGASYGVEEIPDRIDVILVAADVEADVEKSLISAISGLAVGRGVTDAYLDGLLAMMSSSEARYTVMCRILRKDLRCGIQAKTVNAIAPGLIVRVPYQRCSGFEKIKKMAWPALMQRKANGMFSYLSSGGRLMTRKGYRYEIAGSGLAEAFAAECSEDKILIGEVVVFTDETLTKPLPRAVSNGIINAFIAGGGDQEHISRIGMFVWGIITEEEFQAGAGRLPYVEMFDTVKRYFEGKSPKIRPIETWDVFDLEEAQTIFKKLIAAGEEGGVVKSLSRDFVWKDQSACDYQIKMKAQAEAEFIITGIYEGDRGKKYEGKLGGINIESSDGLIVCDCGGGHYMTDAFRSKPLTELEKLLVGQIATVKFYGIAENEKRPGLFALDHPQFEDFRIAEKDEADDMDYCVAALKGEVKG